MSNDYQGKAFADGIVEGFTADATFTPVAATYGAGDVVGTTQEMLFLNRRDQLVPEKSLIRVFSAIVKIGIAAVPSGQTGYTLQCYNVTPPSAQADNAAWTLAAGDLDSYLGSIALGSPVSFGGALYVRTQAIDTDFRLITPSLFTRLVTDGGHAMVATVRSVRLNAVVI